MVQNLGQSSMNSGNRRLLVQLFPSLYKGVHWKPPSSEITKGQPAMNQILATVYFYRLFYWSTALFACLHVICGWFLDACQVLSGHKGGTIAYKAKIIPHLVPYGPAFFLFKRGLWISPRIIITFFTVPGITAQWTPATVWICSVLQGSCIDIHTQISRE